jgi:hypothetical protein
LPFFATFAVGIFIAGLFGFGGPRWGGHGRWRMRAEMDRMQNELDDVREENTRLKNSCHAHERDFDGTYVPDLDAPLPPPMPAPMPHHPPRR